MKMSASGSSLRIAITADVSTITSEGPSRHKGAYLDQAHGRVSPNAWRNLWLSPSSPPGKSLCSAPFECVPKVHGRLFWKPLSFSRQKCLLDYAQTGGLLHS